MLPSPSTTHRASLAAAFPPAAHHPSCTAMTLSDFFFHPSSSPATSTSTTSTNAIESHEPALCDDDITTTATLLLEPLHQQEHEHGHELEKYDGAEVEKECCVIEDMFTFRLDKVLEYVSGHVNDTLRNPKLVLGVGWHEETNTPIGEVDVQFKAVSVVKVSVW